MRGGLGAATRGPRIAGAGGCPGAGVGTVCLWRVPGGAVCLGLAVLGRAGDARRSRQCPAVLAARMNPRRPVREVSGTGPGRESGRLAGRGQTPSERSISVHGARRIIIGTSGTPGSLQALRHAAGIARRTTPRSFPCWPGCRPAATSLTAVIRQGSCARSGGTRPGSGCGNRSRWPGAGSPAGRPAEPKVLRGDPGEVLVAAACEPGDLLVVGAGRRGAVRHLVSSWVSRYCLVEAACPVVAVPPADLDRAPATACAAGPSGTGPPHGAVPAGR